MPEYVNMYQRDYLQNSLSPIYKTALYIRLSREETTSDKSNKIENQKILLLDFIQNTPGFEFIDIYCDNGKTGKNYKRPEWNRMLSDIVKGKIDCVIVKDLSRLGRNYRKTEEIMEEIFPSLGVRLIAISNNYDSAKAGPDSFFDYTITNISNDLYSYDLGVKISGARQMQRQRGEFTGSLVPYGFWRDPLKKGHFLIHENTAETVRLIFHLMYEGNSYSSIARHLNLIGIPSPKGVLWNYVTIKNILQNRAYIGEMVQGQNSKESKIIVKQEAHAAIIDKELFETIQKYIANVENKEIQRRLCCQSKKKKDRAYLFNGYLYSDGSIPFTKVHYFKNNGKVLVKAYKTSRVFNEKGNYHQLIQVREEVILDTFKKTLHIYLSALAAMDDYMNQDKARDYYDNKIHRLEKEWNMKKQTLSDAYINMVDGVIKPENYFSLRDQYISDITAIEMDINEKKRLSSKQANITLLQNPFIKQLKEIGKDYHITKDLITLLIEKIIVRSSKDIEFVFKFADEFCCLEALHQNTREADNS